MTAWTLSKDKDEEIRNNLIDLGVTIKEVRELPPIEKKDRVFLYKIQDEFMYIDIGPAIYSGLAKGNF